MAALQAHGWPGNVPELRNVIERAMAYSPVPAELRAEHLRSAAPEPSCKDALDFAVQRLRAAVRGCQ
jgi:transcriptional regulator with PAS, ATPase and Fis domain